MDLGINVCPYNRRLGRLGGKLSLLDGQVIGECLPRHRSREFIGFLARLDREAPPDLALHLIVDNASTHRSPLVKRWLTRHPRFLLHFIPTGSSWLNMVEPAGFATSPSAASAHPPWHLPQRQGIDHGDPRLPSSVQSGPDALRLDQGCRHDPGQDPSL
jgi:hypothetical protein